MGENFEKMGTLDNEDWNKSEINIDQNGMNDGDKV